MVTLYLNCTMNVYKDMHLVGLGDTRLGKNGPWEITAAPIIVAVLVDAGILDRLGYNW